MCIRDRGSGKHSTKSIRPANWPSIAQGPQDTRLGSWHTTRSPFHNRGLDTTLCMPVHPTHYAFNNNTHQYTFGLQEGHNTHSAFWNPYSLHNFRNQYPEFTRGGEAIHQIQNTHCWGRLAQTPIDWDWLIERLINCIDGTHSLRSGRTTDDTVREGTREREDTEWVSHYHAQVSFSLYNV